MKKKNNGSIEVEIQRIKNKIASEKEAIEKLELLKSNDYYESENHELFLLNNSIKSGKLRVIHSWRSEGLVVCDKIYTLGQYKIYEDCALLYSLSKSHRYDPASNVWTSNAEGFINKDCPDYFNFFNRNNNSLRKALTNLSKTNLYKENSNEIPSWLQDFFILM